MRFGPFCLKKFKKQMKKASNPLDLRLKSGTSVYNGFDKPIIKPARIHIFRQSIHSISCSYRCTIQAKEVKRHEK